MVKLKSASKAGSGQALTEEQVRLAEIVGKMNDLFSGDITESDLVV